MLPRAYGLLGDAFGDECHRFISEPPSTLAVGVVAGLACAGAAGAEACLSWAAGLLGKVGRKSVGEISK
jgi:hypothetical protein